MRRKRQAADIEVSVGPHPAREDWSVLRVTYPTTPEYQERVARALAILYGPPPATDDEAE